MLVPIRLPPGIYRSGTDYQSKGRWRDANLIRFVDDRIEPVGGWVNAQGATVGEQARGMHTWRANTAGRFLGIGSISSLWAFDGDQLFDITPAAFPAGNADMTITAGYGSGDYGSGNFGASGSGSSSEATTWSLDNFGQTFLAMASHNGVLYEWALAGGVPATITTNAPIGRSMFVTAERFVVILGAGGDPRKVSWSDQEDRNQWTPGLAVQSGDILIQTEGALIRGLRTRGQSLILSTTDAHTMRYVGPDLVYGFERVGESCGLVGSNAATAFSGGAVWMGRQSFFGFNGTGVQPLKCEVADLVFTDINVDELAKVSCEQRAAFSEITWHYPAAGSLVNDRYVTWNYTTNVWMIGTLARSSAVDAGVFDFPFACDNAGILYEHEKGWTADGVARGGSVFLESGPVEVGDGDRVLSVTQILPDEVTPGAFRIRLAAKFTPEGPAFNYGPYALQSYTDVRVTGREIAIKIEGVTDMDSRIGIFRADVRPGGRR